MTFGAYSVLATCALSDVNPAEYLADVLPKLARGTFTRSELAAMTPAAWKQARATADNATNRQASTSISPAR